MAILSNFALKHSQFLLSKDDNSSDYLINKLVAGDNISISTRNDEEVNLKGLFSGTHQSTSVEGNIKRASNIVSMVPTDLGFLDQYCDSSSSISA